MRDPNPLSLRKIYETRSDYDAARPGRFRPVRNVPAMGASGDFHARDDYTRLRLIEYSRDIARNDIIANAAIKCVVDNVVQNGFRVKPDTGNPELDAELKSEWDYWCSHPDMCDITGEHTFHELTHMVMNAVMVDGDILAVGTKGGKIELIEAHRIRTPTNTKRNVVHGVLLDNNRRRKEYWVTKDEIDPYKQVSRVSDMRRLPVRSSDGRKYLWHVCNENSRRISQTRGVPCITPVMDAIGMHGDLQFAGLVKQQVASLVAFVRKQTHVAPGSRPGKRSAMGNVETETAGDGSEKTYDTPSFGMELKLNSNEELEILSGNIPGDGFFEHVNLILTIIGANVGAPKHVILLDPSNTNFSGFRGAIDQARNFWRVLQQRLINDFIRPAYEFFVQRQLAYNPRIAKMLEGVKYPESAIFNPPVWNYLEPLTDRQAEALAVKSMLTSRSRLHASRNVEFEEVAREIARDNAMLIREAILATIDLHQEFSGLEEEIGQLPTWQTILTLNNTDNPELAAQEGQAAVAAQAQQEANEQAAKQAEQQQKEKKNANK